MMVNFGKRLSREERQQNLEFARAWRIENKPYFDAIYGPDERRVRCPNCGGRGSVAEPAG